MGLQIPALGIRPGDGIHAGRLITMEHAVLYACTRCQRLLDSEGWARRCPGRPPVMQASA